MEESPGYISIDETKIPLKRVLGLGTGILLVAGIMIGSGVFKKIAPMSAALMSGPYILAAWIIAGIFTIFGAFTLAGFAGATTESGGVYEYLRLSVGDFFSFLYGWTIFTIIGSGSIAALAYIFSQSLQTLLPVPDLFHWSGSGIQLVAIVSIGLLTWVNIRGAKQGGQLNNVVTAAKIIGILLIIVLGLFYSHRAGNTMSAAVNTAGIGFAARVSALFGAMLSAFWAYDGWANISFVTGEMKNPKRNVPLAILAGVGLSMFLYVLLNYAYLRVLPVETLAKIGENDIAAAVVAGALLGKTGTTVISVLIMISTFGALNACVIVYPRIYFRMAQENFFFKKIAKVHPSFRTPYLALLVSMVWSILLVLTGTFDLLTNLVIFAGFFFYILLAVGLIRLKRRGMIASRVTGYPVIPVIVILFSAVIIINTIIVQPTQSLLGLLLLMSGLPFFFYFRREKGRISG